MVAGAGLLLAAVWDSLVFVDETEHVVVERFGRIVAVYDRAGDRGLRFKWPRPVEVVRRFDRRVQLLDPPAREVFTGTARTSRSTSAGGSPTRTSPRVIGRA